MAYGYYQQSGMPGWGTNQFRFGAPPAPGFQPQPTWGGTDFYRAHALTSDPYLFDHAWNRVREYGGAPAGGIGVGLHEARHWHHRAYGGLHEIGLMQPHEIGHAAAYEAYRTWIHNSSIYEPLSGDIERQREALTGLAVAEASRLLQYSSHPMDNYARLAVSEAAAHTASYIFYQSRDGEYRSRSQYRQSYDDPYACDDDALFPRSRSHSAHHRSRSRRGSFSQSGAIPGQAYSTSSAPMGSYGSYSSSRGIPVSTPYPHGVALPPSSSYGPMISPPYSAPYDSAPYDSAPYDNAALDVASSYQGSSLGAPLGYARSRSSSFSYPQQAYPRHQQGYPYGYQQGYQQGYSDPAYSTYAPSYHGMGSAMSSSSMVAPMTSVPAGGPTTIIIHKSRKSKHGRARSSSRY